MIEKYQGYTAVRKVGQGFRPVGKHPFRIIHNTRVIKFDLIQQFEESTGIILPVGVRNNLCTQVCPVLGKELTAIKLQIKDNKNENYN